jgi:serine phosphatase RsbU (regulator of sigma subunit)
MPILKLASEYGDNGTFHFDRSVLLGRERTADLTINHPSVSRRHARILRMDDGACVLSDLRSVNGTFLNGRPVLTNVALQDGDRLAFGSIEAVFLERRRETEAVGLTRPAGAPVAGSDGPASDGPHEQFGALATFMSKLAQVTAGSFDLDALLAFVLNEVFDLISRAGRAALLTPDLATGEQRIRIARDRYGDAVAFDVTTLAHERPDSGTTISRRRSTSISAALRTIGGMSTAVAPLIFDGRCVGLLVIDNGGAGMALRRVDLQVLKAIAQPVAQALAYAQLKTLREQQTLLEQDLQFARKVQQHFLPSRPPEIDGFDITVTYLPALAVGGDFYDFLRLDETRTGFLIGDVSGKGVSAALYAARISSDLRYLAPREGDPAAMLGDLNERVSTLARDGMFVTAALAIFDRSSGQVSIASAGHQPPLVRRSDGTLFRLSARQGVPLGVDHTHQYTSQQYLLQPGEAMLFYTDGVVDAADARGKRFGTARFENIVRRGPAGAVDLQQQLLSALHEHVGEHLPYDDIIVVVLSRRGVHPKRQSGARASGAR